MGSANGRHRRPRQAPAIVVAAGVTGSAIAIPLLGAGAAQAADATTWDRVAECESGGTWSADFGNGSYGGLQLTPETWKAYGGESYAPRADLASRAQQIAVAEKILDARGPKAWPSCAVISGLATDGTLPGVDPGTTPSAEPTGATGNEQASGDASTSPADGATPSGEAEEPKGDAEPSTKPPATESASPSSDPSRSADAGDAPGSSGSSGSSPSGSSSTSDPSVPSDSSGSSVPSRVPGSAGAGGKHRGAPAAEEGRGSTGGDDRESGRHASRGEGGARDAGAPVADDAYTVRPGDNLWAIADAQKVPGGWTALYESNKDVVGSDPDLILPGQSLDLDVKAD
ncbi:transglycosylase family protein [Streptomyces sp. NPDC056061]|uniref:transglycosylase family protein n=1 Tax=Streptomyces sp. NPDC056061 TaxID=3345700 RepID=UPI0035DA796C